MQDRRSGDERRSIDRDKVTIDVEWQTGAVRELGTLSDLSSDGCFVMSSGDVNDGDPVKVFIPLAEGMKVEFTGVVANHVVEIGFGVEFDQLSAAQRDVIRRLADEDEPRG
jgi:hypothetical protein